MEQHDHTDEPALRMRSGRIGRIVAAGALAAGLAVGGYAIAGAATSTTTGSSATRPTATAPSINSTGGDAQHAGNDGDGRPPVCDPASMPHGPGEKELTGDTADKVRTAALGAVPGGTIVRIETDSSGETPYEAHVKKADGTFVVVQVKSDFTVAATRDGFGGPPQGDRHQGPPPGGAAKGDRHQGPPPGGAAKGDGHQGPCLPPPPPAK